MDRQQRVAAARRALRQALSAKIVAEEAGPPCRDCSYCGDEKPIPVCHHLAYAEPRFDPAFGRFSGQSSRLITSARSDDGLCGPEALLFDPKTVLIRLRELATGETATAIYTVSALFFLIFAGVWIY